MSERSITFAQAINEALIQGMTEDPNVYIMGEGVPDPKGIFGTTTGLRDKFGENRVLDMPVAENGMTGVAIGSAIMGMRPILTHQRVDFALLAMDQMVNQAAKWHYMFGGKHIVPLVIRLIVGRGWGQGPQHSQSLQSWFAHIPGLKVVMPTTPQDAKGLLLASIRDDNPVIFLEHRWLHNISDRVKSENYDTPLGKARISREGEDLTIVSTSYMTLEALRVAEWLEKAGVSTEVVDVRSLRPLDTETIVNSVEKTGKLLVTDTGWTNYGVTAEIMALVTEQAFSKLKCAPRRVALPDVPTPTSHAVAQYYYPRATDLYRVACDLLEMTINVLKRL
ncbi:alpha-ketoacid dehydrogenase subunit beta [Crocosphaera watsonii]|uniref:Acetoin dehydrogenase E1 component beta-subunit n=1 Tax=Crocosphaera watsonii WH 0401 TaxID=555881 RepID=T2J701_CROWT|nr:alpha-ketoacid dehydrogenase subunit beta [Crocosphaera watsonii]CCQ61653.1 Acetoin dehydrogenase E1 component beta-subunit [Crocosphaera watsonii WH 0401]